jgi:phenylalanyl-tRNA synthetase alpha subunit
MSIIDELESLKTAALASIDEAADLSALDAVRVDVLGKKGSLTGVLRGLGALSAEERPAVGKVSNEVRSALEQALEARKAVLADAALSARVAADAVDVTLPGRKRLPGRKHLINQITDEVVDIFTGLGYAVAEGPRPNSTTTTSPRSTTRRPTRRARPRTRSTFATCQMTRRPTALPSQTCSCARTPVRCRSG